MGAPVAVAAIGFVTGEYLLPLISALVLVYLRIACWPQQYVTQADGLSIRAGVTRRLIRYDSITAVRPTRDASSALALSLDRVLIEYDETAIMIAPERQQEFLTDLSSHAPRLAPANQTLRLKPN
jgi:hypothetical protein